MPTQKVDSQLNLALDVPEELRQESSDLNVGFIQADNRWEVIVKYVGSLERIKKELDVQVTELLNEFAIIVIKESLIGALAAYDEIIFIEKPKALSTEVINGISASCMNQAQRPPYNLSGKGVMVAVVDSGIDYAHPDFRNEDGTSRILYLWDQTIQGKPPEGYYEGTLYTKEQIDEALKATTFEGRDRLVPSNDTTGHGTNVAGICCGNGRASNGRYRGVAYESDIVVVKLGRSIGNSFASTAQLMEAINFCVTLSIERNQPLVINVSFGNSYGSHSGTSLLETFIDGAASVGRNNIVIGSGNEGDAGRHAYGILKEEVQQVALIVGERETDLNLQIWHNPYDIMDISLVTPSGVRVGPFNRSAGSNSYDLTDSKLYVYYGEPSPFSIYTEIFFAWIPKQEFVQSGQWVIELAPQRILRGEYFMWLPSGNAINPTTRFLRPSVETTLTIPSTARRAISVGAYNSNDDSLATFSGRGFTVNNSVKPEIVAPGVGIMSSASGGGYSRNTGTSFATPFVTGACALLMQWGIIEKNDLFLYGEKTKAYLLATTRKLESFTRYPNEAVGFGALCLREDF